TLVGAPKHRHPSFEANTFLFQRHRSPRRMSCDTIPQILKSADRGAKNYMPSRALSRRLQFSPNAAHQPAEDRGCLLALGIVSVAAVSLLLVLSFCFFSFFSYLLPPNSSSSISALRMQ